MRPTPKRSKLPLIIGCCLLAIGIATLLFFNMENDATGKSGLAAETDSSLAVNDIDSGPQPTPLIAEYGDVLIHCPINTDVLTEICFHQSETYWAVVLDTQLSYANLAEAYDHQGTNRSDSQPTGDTYLDCEALQVWRTTATMPINTAIDCGAAAGSAVYAPVSGTVVLVQTYTLEGTLEDYEIHIQPTGHPELDMVVIHVQDVCVQAGDEVTGGLTQIASVRDLASFIDGIQLADYTPVETGGNHTHIQLNDVTYEGYRETKLQGATTVD